MIIVVHGIAIDEQNNVWRTHLSDGKHYMPSPHIKAEGNRPNDNNNKISNGSNGVQ